ncbi:hypothetical protein BKA62DRAFT_672570 [Auriculariales sp. MPI-PUGE-AT-0066]|nr:hypothetical protein BKA62DRAFT_672570 [Auriculariales sp. MPI-PUGE-AT-0066]
MSQDLRRTSRRSQVPHSYADTPPRRVFIDDAARRSAKNEQLRAHRLVAQEGGKLVINENETGVLRQENRRIGRSPLPPSSVGTPVSWTSDDLEEALPEPAASTGGTCPTWGSFLEQTSKLMSGGRVQRNVPALLVIKCLEMDLRSRLQPTETLWSHYVDACRSIESTQSISRMRFDLWRDVMGGHQDALDHAILALFEAREFCDDHLIHRCTALSTAFKSLTSVFFNLQEAVRNGGVSATTWPRPLAIKEDDPVLSMPS